MRVMLDTNVIISYVLFKNETMEMFYNYVLNNEELVISNYIIDELKEVFKRKFKDKIYVLDAFLNDLDIESISIDMINDLHLFKIRDQGDYPILYSAIVGNVDIFITGDEDFKSVVIEKPKIMTISEYMDYYM